MQPGDPQQLGDYRILRRLGEGGYGVVYLGETSAGEQVAVKLLRTQLAGDRVAFAREVETAKRVARFCTAQVLDADLSGEHPYIVSEYVEGPSLQSYVADRGPLSGGALERLAIGTATALAAIHQAGIVHRDFKPHNVLMGPDGPRVIDFGIARMVSAAATVSSRVVGTPAYMAPEQISAKPVGPSADVFAWAATLVYAATSDPPFGQDSIPAVAHRIMTLEPDLGGLQDPLRAVVIRCLAKNPDARPHAHELLLRLLGQEEAAEETRRVADDVVPTEILAAAVTRAAPVVPGGTIPTGLPPVTRPVLTPPPPRPPGRGQRPGRRRLWPALVAAAAALLLAGSGVAAAMRWADSPPDKKPSVATGATAGATSSGADGSARDKQPGTTSQGYPKPTCTVTPQSLNLGSSGTSGSVTLRATVASYTWTAATASGPVSVHPASGTVPAGGSGSATITASVGNPRVPGSGSVRFSTGCGSRTVTVGWQGKASPTFKPTPKLTPLATP